MKETSLPKAEELKAAPVAPAQTPVVDRSWDPGALSDSEGTPAIAGLFHVVALFAGANTAGGGGGGDMWDSLWETDEE